MTLQNRVLPTGEIAALPARGLFMGNRGILHGANRQLGTARWRHPHWIICQLAFKGRRRPVMAPGRYTELFFLDEAVALAAGHRPCAECRRAAYLAYRTAWAEAETPGAGASQGAAPDAAAMDRALHRARVRRDRSQITHRAPARDLPDGTFIRGGGRAMLVWKDSLMSYSPDGYTAKFPRNMNGDAEVLTPAPSVAALAAGYRPVLHPSAGTAAA